MISTAKKRYICFKKSYPPANIVPSVGWRYDVVDIKKLVASLTDNPYDTKSGRNLVWKKNR
ncbi:MAG: hypothetical protein IPN09_17075 [Bacteroidetes bacterium]|nr:hypothetical protein [Bacteroidota bacterium]